MTAALSGVVGAGVATGGWAGAVVSATALVDGAVSTTGWAGGVTGLLAGAGVFDSPQPHRLPAVTAVITRRNSCWTEFFMLRKW